MGNLIDFWQNNEFFRITVLILFPCIIFYILYKSFRLTEDDCFDKKEAFMAAAILTPPAMLIVGGLFVFLLSIIYKF